MSEDKKKKDLKNSILNTLKDYAEGKLDYGLVRKNGELYMYTMNGEKIKEVNVKDWYRKIGIEYTDLEESRLINSFAQCGKKVEEI